MLKNMEKISGEKLRKYKTLLNTKTCIIFDIVSQLFL